MTKSKEKKILKKSKKQKECRMPKDSDESIALKELETIFLKASGGKKHTYQRIEHDYFKDWSHNNKDIDKKCDVIKKHISSNIAIDLGANNGYVCRSLVRNNKFPVYAIGVNKSGGSLNYGNIQNEFSKIGFPSIDFREERVQDFMMHNHSNYQGSSVIALALFHWFLKNKKSGSYGGYDDLVNIIAPWIERNARQFFFEYCPLSKSVEPYKRLNKEQWKSFWIKHCKFESCKELYVSKFMGRTILLFEKKLSSDAYEDDIIYVNPKMIKYMPNNYVKHTGIKMWHNRDGFAGIKKIRVGGDWDLNPKSFKKSDVNRHMKLRFVSMQSWESICKKFGSNCPQLSKNKQRSSDNLYKSMRKSGYMRRPNAGAWDEACVSIGRDGSLFLHNARHRVAVSSILGIKEIPVRVLMVHADYKGELVRGRQFVRVNGG